MQSSNGVAKNPSTRSDATNPTLLRLCAGYDRMAINIPILSRFEDVFPIEDVDFPMSC